jgi:hypothetical protein
MGDAASVIADHEVGQAPRSAYEVNKHMQAFVEIMRAFNCATVSPVKANQSASASVDNLYPVFYNRRTAIALFQATHGSDIKNIWNKVERQTAKDPDMEVLLLASSDLLGLEHTHGRYFTSTPGPEA